MLWCKMKDITQRPRVGSRGKPGPPCQVCASGHAPAINYALTAGKPLRAIAEQFDISFWSIGRHARKHLSATQRAAILTQQRPAAVDVDALRDREASSLLTSVLAGRARLEQIAERAHAVDDLRAAVAAESAVSANLALTGKLLGQLVQRVDVRHSNLLLTPDYARLREILMRRLRASSDPDIARLVASDLAALDADSARDITEAAKAKRPARPEPKVIEHAPAAPADDSSARALPGVIGDHDHPSNAPASAVPIIVADRDNAARAPWSPPDSPLKYTPREIEVLTPVRNELERRATIAPCPVPPPA